jgi:hypothetical protein
MLWGRSFSENGPTFRASQRKVKAATAIGVFMDANDGKRGCKYPAKPTDNEQLKVFGSLPAQT